MALDDIILPVSGGLLFGTIHTYQMLASNQFQSRLTKIAVWIVLTLGLLSAIGSCAFIDSCKLGIEHLLPLYSLITYAGVLSIFVGILVLPFAVAFLVGQILGWTIWKAKCTVFNERK
jgi:hypothetical protein